MQKQLPPDFMLMDTPEDFQAELTGRASNACCTRRKDGSDAVWLKCHQHCLGPMN